MKKYTVYRYPALNGAPWESNSFIHAWLFAWFCVASLSFAEALLRQNGTGREWRF